MIESYKDSSEEKQACVMIYPGFLDLRLFDKIYFGDKYQKKGVIAEISLIVEVFGIFNLNSKSYVIIFIIVKLSNCKDLYFQNDCNGTHTENRRKNMAKQKSSRPAGKNHSADIKNANKGTKGTNITYDKNQGNRGKQLNPNWKKK